MKRRAMRGWNGTRSGYWFRPKLFGYGATPVTWQGWAVTLGFVAVTVALAAAGDPILLVFIPPVVLSLVLVARGKTDGDWRWRWGSD